LYFTQVSLFANADLSVITIEFIDQADPPLSTMGAKGLG
jgi:hypothetical protein